MTVGSRHHLSWGRAAGRRAHVMRTGRAPRLRISTCHDLGKPVTRRLGPMRPMSLIGAAATGRRRDENTSHSSISQTAASSNFRNDSHPNHRNVRVCA